jgi:ABC-type branched-subunit amino acid transport system substrate-binding protein
VTSAPITTALTLSLMWRFQRQGTEAAEEVWLWAEAASVRLILVDDQGSKEVAVGAYGRWIDTADLLIGPYVSGLVRAIAPLVHDAGRALWNHSSSADDLAQPDIASLPAPASSYFDGVVNEAVDRRLSSLIVVQAPGPFARAVADGARNSISNPSEVHRIRATRFPSVSFSRLRNCRHLHRESNAKGARTLARATPP